MVWQSTVLPPQDSDGEATGGGLAFHDGTLYVSSGFGVLTAFDAASGKERWRQELDATGSGTPSVIDNIVYLVAGDDTGWGAECRDGPDSVADRGDTKRIQCAGGSVPGCGG